MTALSENGLPPRRSEHLWTGPAGSWSYDLWGDAGRPVVLLHGPTFDRTMWWPVGAELAGDCTVVALDLPGHGGSVARSSYRPADLLADVAQLTADLGRRQAPVVVGHAASALLACLFGAAVAVRATVTVGQPLDVRALAGGPPDPREVVTIPPEYRSLVRPQPDGAMLAEYLAWTAGHGPEQVQRVVDGALERATAPHVSVLGEPPDPGYPRWLSGLVPGARCVVYPNAGLFPHLRDVSRFAGEVRALL